MSASGRHNRKRVRLESQKMKCRSLLVYILFVLSSLSWTELYCARALSWEATSMNIKRFAMLQTHGKTMPVAQQQKQPDSSLPERPISMVASNAKSNGFQRPPALSRATVPSSEKLEPPELYQSNNDRSMSTTEMITMSAAGALFSIGVVYALAMRSAAPESPLEPPELQLIADNILDAAFPLTAPDVVSVTLGEVVGGIIGALASFGISWAVKWQQKKTVEGLSQQNVIATGDYFLAKSASFPLFEATGLSPILASLASVVFAIVPYELVKIGSQRRKDRLDEDKLLQELLDEQQNSPQTPFSILSFNANPSSVDPESLKPAGKDERSKLDIVEIFSDITQWLEYDVLMTDFGGRLTVVPGAESALYGAMAALSAQIYADVLYAYFGIAGSEKQRKVRSRKLSEWSTIYLTRILSAATLFGVYDASQIPAKAFISTLFSGGAEGCLGSDDFNLCVETFLVNNPPEASLDAQVRALITTLYSLWSNLVGNDFDLSTLF